MFNIPAPPLFVQAIRVSEPITNADRRHINFVTLAVQLLYGTNTAIAIVNENKS